MEQERLKRRVKEAYFFSACVQASYYPFYIVFLKSRNLEYFQIGLCFALSSLVGVICQPVWGYITDKCKYKRNMLLFLMMGSNISVIFILLSHSFITLLLMTIMLSVFMSSVATVLDSIGIEISMFYENMNFNRMRLMNSIGWAVCAVLIGIVVNMTFASSSLLIYITFNTVCMFSVYGINFETKTRSQGLKLQHAFDLFKNKRFTIFVLSTLFLNFSVSVHSNYLEVLIKTTGGSVSILGLVFSIISMCEVPTFFYGNIILKKFNSIDLYKLCIVFYSIRFLLEPIAACKVKPVVNTSLSTILLT